MGAGREAALQCAHDRGGDARRVPIHSHHRAQCLKPERIAETREKRRRTVVVDDRLGDRCAEPGHAFGQPLRNPAAV